MKNLIKNVMAVAVLVTIGVAAQAQDSGTRMKEVAKTESVKGTKLKDRSATAADNVRAKPMTDQPGTGLKTETERPASNTVKPSAETKQSPKTGTARGDARGIDEQKAKRKHAKSNVPRGKAHGWYRNQGLAQPRS